MTARSEPAMRDLEPSFRENSAAIAVDSSRRSGQINTARKDNWDAAAFYEALARAVAARGKTWKRVAQETGVSASTLSRMADGRRPDAASLAALSAWSGLNPAQFMLTEPPARQVRFGADALASAIREMVKADIDRDGARYTLHETAMREQLHALEQELHNAHRQIYFRAVAGGKE